MRRRAWTAWCRAAGASAALTAVWLGAQAGAWRWHLNAGWEGLPDLDAKELWTVVAASAAACLLLLWSALRRSGDSAALERAVALLLLIAVGSAGAAVFAYAVLGVPVGAVASLPTGISILVIALSPLLYRIIVATWAPRRERPLPSDVHELLSTLDLPKLDNGPEKAPRPLIDVVPRAELTIGEAIEWRPHIRKATIAGSGEQLVFKEFDRPGAGPIRNPIRPLASYRKLLSQVSRWPPEDRADAERVLLWPRTVVAEGEYATGVVYKPIASPFLLATGYAQTGDFLWSQNPKHQGSRVVTVIQRGQILYDVVRAHELLHKLNLAHGDTAWKNFVYGVEDDRARGQLIDIDGITDVGDPKPTLLHQAGWEVDSKLPPVCRDQVRVALLIARLAAPQPQADSRDIPEQAVYWFTPWLRKLTKDVLDRPCTGASLVQFRLALDEAL